MSIKIKELEKIRNNYETKMTKYGLAFLDGDYWKVITANSKIELLHRYVYEKEVGQIPPNWVVHHLDNDKWNNNPANLKAMPMTEHISLHSFDYWDSKNKSNKFRVENFESIV